MKTKPNSWYDIRAQATADSPVDVFLYDEIGGWGTSAKDFIAALQPYKDRAITLRVSSPGGSIFDGLAIYNYLRGLNVTTKVDGLAASIASVVALAGKTVRIAKNGFFMVHNPAGFAMGGEKEMDDMRALLARLRESMVLTYARETGSDREEIEKWMDEETWFNSEEAKAAGLADEVEEDDEEMALTASLDLSKFTNPPKALIDSQQKDNTQMSKETIAPEKTFIESLKAMLGIGQQEPLSAEIKASAKETQLLADLSTARQTIGSLETQVKTLEADLNTTKAELATAKSDLEKAKAELPKQAAQQAAAITAAQGQPPVAAVPNDNPKAAADKPDFSKLKGLEKAIAAHKAIAASK